MQRSDVVLKYWFGTRGNDLEVLVDKASLWFASGAEVDEEIRQQFGEDVAQAGRGELDAWADSPRGCLALVILLDQFTRNIYRGTPDAFALDDKALSVAKAGITRGHDQALRPVERTFLYMPLMHAEDLSAQDLSIKLFEQLVAQHEGKLKSTFEQNLAYSHRHRDLIVAFGRFPHRNEILGRTSTTAELKHLTENNEAFGQTKR